MRSALCARANSRHALNACRLAWISAKIASSMISFAPVASSRLALDLMDITARRNAFGRQLDSFEADLAIPAIGEDPLRAVFIRAPVLEAPGKQVAVLATLNDGRIVAAQQGHLLATAFHPELTGDDRFHRYFLEL